MGRRWWAGPGLGQAGPSIFYVMGRGPTRPVKFSEDGPRPGPAHHISNKSRPGPARSIIFSNVSARLGLAHNMTARPMKHGLYMGRPDNYVGRPVDLTAGPMCCSVTKRACTHYANVKFSV